MDYDSTIVRTCRVNLEWKLTSSSNSFAKNGYCNLDFTDAFQTRPYPGPLGLVPATNVSMHRVWHSFRAQSCRSHGAKCYADLKVPVHHIPLCLVSLGFSTSTFPLKIPLGSSFSKHCPLQCHPESDLAIGWSEGIKYLALKIAIAVALSCAR